MIENIGKAKTIIAKRVALELEDGQLVNLGIGLPSLVANYIPEDIEVLFQSENGMVGMGPVPPEGSEDYHITNAGGGPVTILKGGSFFDSSLSFSLIRGGHVDVTVLGTLEVDREGSIANWIIPGRLVPGMGGAMDLVVGAKKVIVATLHTNKGRPKILEKCTLPLTAYRQVDMIVTEMGVFKILQGQLILEEINEAATIGQIKSMTEASFVISNNLKKFRSDSNQSIT